MNNDIKKLDIIIDSSKRNTSLYTSPSYFVYTFQNYLNVVHRVTLRNCSIFNTSYSVNNNNNTMKITTTSSYMITIPNGNYNPSTLSTALQLALNTSVSGYTFTVSANTTTNKFTITATAGGTFTYNASSYPLNSLLLGYNPVDVGPNTTFTSNNVYLITPTPYYYLSIKEFPTLSETNSNNNVLGVIYNNVPSGSLLSFNSNCGPIFTRDFTDLNVTNLKNMSIQLLDSNYNQVDLNNINYLLEFEIYFKK